MPSATAVLSQILDSRFTRRLTRLLLGGFVAFWLLDHIIFLVTDYQWFASVGFQELLLSRWRIQTGMFAAFCGFCLILTVAVMRSVLKPAAGEEPQVLNGSLRRLEPLRAVALRWSWAILLVWMVLLARALAREWPVWKQLLQNKSLGFSVPYYGLDAGFWVYWLPFLEHSLSVLWRYSLILFLLATVAGVLRALPLVAARRPVTPVKFNRALIALVVWLLALRAAGYALAFFSVAGNRFDGAGLFLARPLDILGAGACLGLAFMALVLHKPKAGRIWWPGWGFVVRVFAVLLLPAVVDFCLSPIWNRVGSHAGIDAARKAASIKAWHLDFEAYMPDKVPIPERVWPVWDENHVLQAIQNRRAEPGEQGAGAAGNKVSQWRTVVIESPRPTSEQPGEARWNAIVAGIAAGEEVQSSSREVGGQSRVVIGEVPLPSTADELKSPESKTLDAPLIYGYEGRTLINVGGEQTPPQEPLGLDARSWRTKLAWGWRFRDLLLPGEAAGGRELVVFRGAEERARLLWPELTPEGSARPVIIGGRVYWLLNLMRNGNGFPGSYRPESGPLAESNFVEQVGLMVMDAHSGKVWFVPAEGGNATVKPPVTIEGNFWLRLRLAQAQVLAKTSGMRVVSSPSSLYLGNGLSRVIVLEGDKQGSLLIEQHQGRSSQVRVWPINGDIAERTQKLHEALNELTSSLGRKPLEDGLKLEAGSPVVWPDALAPGGWWIAQAHYVVPDPGATQSKDYTRLQSMAIAGATGKVGVGRSWSEAVTEWQASQPVIPVPQGNDISTEQLAATALRLHDQAQKAFSAAKYTEFNRYSEAERKILEQLSRASR